MTMHTITVFCPVKAAEARKLVNAGRFEMIHIPDFEPGRPIYDGDNRLAFFAIKGDEAAFMELWERVEARVKASAPGRPRAALLDVMFPSYAWPFI
ncbi:MAG: hypothetical protein E6R08_04050 [Nevskiaceae bacterium]|nr:MAG: hypothetical protein E6R08_04050 [Nevskiaceae bacterium]